MNEINNVRDFTLTPSNMTKQRPKTAVWTDAQPVMHKPCSATLGKFHDGVNYSLAINKLNESDSPHQQHHHQHPHPSQHYYSNRDNPIFKAKDKYKYMVRVKTYVDETLFETNKNKYNREVPNDFNVAPSSQHLSHALMSNITPLIHNPMPKISLGSSRMETSHQQQQYTNRPSSAASQSRQAKPIAPWRP